MPAAFSRQARHDGAAYDDDRETGDVIDKFMRQETCYLSGTGAKTIGDVIASEMIRAVAATCIDLVTNPCMERTNKKLKHLSRGRLRSWSS